PWPAPCVAPRGRARRGRRSPAPAGRPSTPGSCPPWCRECLSLLPASDRLDLDVDPAGEVEVHQGVDGALGGRLDVDQPVVRADLEVLTAVLVRERAAQHAEAADAGGQRHGARDGGGCAPHGLDDLGRRAVEAAVVERLQLDADLRCCHGYFVTAVTTPAPTVRPPSRIAKRSPSSMAIGLISSTLSSTLSPGITISTPSGSVTTPVTSVVRK